MIIFPKAYGIHFRCPQTYDFRASAVGDVWISQFTTVNNIFFKKIIFYFQAIKNLPLENLPHAAWIKVKGFLDTSTAL
jgi:hypothetical protein